MEQATNDAVFSALVQFCEVKRGQCLRRALTQIGTAGLVLGGGIWALVDVAPDSGWLLMPMGLAFCLFAIYVLGKYSDLLLTDDVLQRVAKVQFLADEAIAEFRQQLTHNGCVRLSDLERLVRKEHAERARQGRLRQPGARAVLGTHACEGNG